MSDDPVPVRSDESVSERLAKIDRITDAAEQVKALLEVASQLLPLPSEVLTQALAAAQTIEDDSDRAIALAEIALQLPESKRFEVLEQALGAAQAIENESARARSLAKIALQLPESKRFEVLEQALSAAKAIENESARAYTLAAIAPHLPESKRFEVLEQALSAAQAIENESDRVYSLAEIAPSLSKSEPQLLQQALSAAKAIENESARANALAAIAPSLPESEPQLLQQALSAAQAIEDEFHRADVLAEIAPQLPEAELQLLQQALTAAANISDESERSRALAAIAPQLPQNYLPQLLKAIPGGAKEDAGQALISPAVRFTEALAVLFPSDKHLVALETVKTLPQDSDKTKFLSALAPCLSLGLLPNALRLIQTAFTQDAYRAEALSNLVPYLPSKLLPEALQIITQSIKIPRHQTTALENLIAFLPLHELKKVLHLLDQEKANSSADKPITEIQPTAITTTVITTPTLKARVLRSVATALSKIPIDAESQSSSSTDSESGSTSQEDRAELIHRIFHLTEQLQHLEQKSFSYEKATTDILSQLAPALTQLQAISASVPQFQDLGYQAQILSALLPYFPAEIAEPFLTTCSGEDLGDDYHALLNIKVQAALLNKLHLQAQNNISENGCEASTVQLNKLNTTLKIVQGQYRKAEALLEIARYPVGEKYQSAALQAIRGLSNTSLKVQYLQHLIPSLCNNQYLEAASIIREIPDSYDRTKALVTLACKFPEFRGEAKTAAQVLPNRVQCVEQLSILAVEVPEILPEIIAIAEKSTAPENTREEDSKENTSEEDTSKKADEEKKKQLEQLRIIQLEQLQILVVLAPHLPMRINREVTRERATGRITEDLWKRALYLLARGYRDALQGGSLRNESAQDKDFLNLQDEVNALSDLLLMRDLEPPMTVGILGGWGGGKSYIMHLMQTHMTEVRSRPVTETEAWNPDPKNEKLSPYVGHIYQIKFDAWTFAKSDLWASLMQTIFFELNRQITLEQKLLKFFKDNDIDPYAKNSLYGNVWKVLYQVRDEERAYFLERVLQKPDLENLDPAQQDKIDELLWKKRNIVKQAATEELQQQETALKNVEDSLKQKKEELNTAKTWLEKSQKPDVQRLHGQVNQILIVSGVLLRKRIGDDAFKALDRQIKALLPDDLNPESLQKFGGDLRLFISNILEGTDADGKPFNFSLKTLKQWGRKNLAFIVLFCGFAAASVLAPFLVAWKLPGAIVPQFVAFVTPLLPAIGMAQKLWRAGQRWHDQTKQALLDCETQIRGSQAVITRETQRFQKHQEERIATLQADIDQYTKQVQELEEQVEIAQRAVPEDVYASLQEFVSNRIKEGIYDKNLGLMHQVKGDLTNLSYRLLPPQLGSEEYVHKLDDLKAVFPRGPARVVVYIDDLDRCPPDRVVQVLEAVQLLVKTPLFIAVLAVDERYITRALEKFYEGVLSKRGRPSGTDYLEKIIQLPYRVRPIMASNLEAYLRSQVVIQDSATGGTKFSEFSRQEFNMLLACCQQVDLSPRTLKRLTNVYKLFKIVCRTRGTKPSLQVQQSILALLALSGRYPNLMRGIFDSIETCFEEQRTPEKAKNTLQTLHLQSSLRDFFKHYQLPEGDRYLQRDFEKLRHDALQTSILPPALTLDDMTHEIFNLIRSFSFVGEIGEDPEDYRISEPMVDDRPNR